MKNILITNIINFMILGVIVAMMFFGFSKPFVYTLLVIWFCLAIYLNYSIIIKSNDIIAELRSVDKRHLFNKHISIISKCYSAIEFKQDFFSNYEEGNSVRASYDLLSKQMTANVIAATNYIRSYDIVSRPDTNYLNKIVSNCQELVEKLNELSELVLKIDDTTSDVDITYVDDMLTSLRKVVQDEQEKF